MPAWTVGSIGLPSNRSGQEGMKGHTMGLGTIRNPGRMPGGRTRARSSAMLLEGLEIRGLMSVAICMPAGGDDLAARSRVAAEVSSSLAARSNDHTLAATWTLDIHSLADRIPGRNVSTDSPARGSSDPAEIVRRAVPPRITPRGPLDIAASPVRRETPTMSEDPEASSSPTSSGGETAAVSGAMGTIGVVASVSGGSPPVTWISSAENPSGGEARSVGPSGSPGALAAAHGTVTGPDEPSAAAAGDGDRFLNAIEARRIPGFAEDGPNREVESPTLVALIDGALHSDWDAVDRDLRQFLAGTMGAGGEFHAGRGGRVWLMRIGTLAAVFATQRAVSSRRRRPWFRFGMAGLTEYAGGRPDAVGPWPLGPS
jgi:hypothetical protein